MLGLYQHSLKPGARAGIIIPMLPLLRRGQKFWSAAYPQDWIIGADFKVAYASNGYEADAMTAIIEEELGL